jgi:hypothetical protein
MKSQEVGRLLYPHLPPPPPPRLVQKPDGHFLFNVRPVQHFRKLLEGNQLVLKRGFRITVRIPMG